jgi:hypothetical protein
MYWPILDGQAISSIGHNSGSDYGTLVTTPLAGADQKGLWSPLGGTAEAVGCFWVYIGDLDSSGGSLGILEGLVDIGFDPAGGTNYSVLVPDIYCTTPGAGQDRGTPFWTFWPMPLPQGGTLAARWQANIAEKTARVYVHTASFGWPSPFNLQHCVAYGMTSIGSTGTTIDPGGTADTQGAWVQIAGSTTRPIRWLNAVHHLANATAQNCGWKISIGVGGSGSEIQIIQNIISLGNVNTDQMRPTGRGYPICIPSASRLAVRASCSIVDASDRLFNIALYGVG